MKSDKKILVAFLLNALFAMVEFVGGVLTGSVAIISDAVHDLGDSISIGLSYILEKRSKKAPDKYYTYGYLRYSVLGGLITSLILGIGSVLVVANAAQRLANPVPIHYDGMILLAIFGAGVNFAAALFTRDGDSLNQKAVNLHMLEDVLGWIVVLIGAVIMKFIDVPFIDPVLSIGVAAFILFHALENIKEVAVLFLEKAPSNVDTDALAQKLEQLPGVEGIHHLHLRSIDGCHHVATIHVITQEPVSVKKAVKEAFHDLGVAHVTVETELPGEDCHEISCAPDTHSHHSHHHAHHHH